MKPTLTSRLHLLELEDADAPFINELYNSPGWLKYIGDRGIRNVAAANAYIAQNYRRDYAHGTPAMYKIELKDTAVPIGICGFVVRTWLPAPDLGFALLPAYVGKGYAREASQAILAHGFEQYGLSRVLAITTDANRASIRLLQRLGFGFTEWVMPPGERERLRRFDLRRADWFSLQATDTAGV